MNEVTVFLTKGQITYTSNKTIGEISIEVYKNYPDNTGFTIKNMDMVEEKDKVKRL